VISCSLSFSFVPAVTAPTSTYTLSLHDALPIFGRRALLARRHRDQHVRLAGELRQREPVLAERLRRHGGRRPIEASREHPAIRRSEEHTSELQSHLNLVCRLLLEKKNIHYRRDR